MSVVDDSVDGHRERCTECGREAPHEVSLELRTENATAANAAFSRQPYRVATCLDCGAESAQRIDKMTSGPAARD